VKEGFFEDSVEGLALRFTIAIVAACDVSVKKLRYNSTKRGVYWWNDEVAQTRRRCIAMRRLCVRGAVHLDTVQMPTATHSDRLKLSTVQALWLVGN